MPPVIDAANAEVFSKVVRFGPRWRAKLPEHASFDFVVGVHATLAIAGVAMLAAYVSA